MDIRMREAFSPLFQRDFIGAMIMQLHFMIGIKPFEKR